MLAVWLGKKAKPQTTCADGVMGSDVPTLLNPYME